MGTAIADNLTSEALRIGFSQIGRGELGPNTIAILEEVTNGMLNPLEEWGDSLKGWSQPLALSSAEESTPSYS